MPSSRRGSRISPSFLAFRKGLMAKLRIWLQATRPWTLPASIAPVLVASGAAVGEGNFRLGVFFAALACSMLIQIGANFANDLSDFKRKADIGERAGPLRVTQAGLLSEKEVMLGTALTFSLALLISLYLIWVGGWPILIVGLLSIVSGILYTGGPWPLGYHGLGDLFVFIFFGVVAVVTTYYLHTGEVNLFSFLLSLPVGFIVTSILVVNNLRDIPTDSKVGKQTLAVKIGSKATRIQFAFLVLGAYTATLAMGLSYAMDGLFFLPLLSIPLACFLVWKVLKGTEGAQLNRILKGTGQLHLLFCVLLALGMV